MPYREMLFLSFNTFTFQLTGNYKLQNFRKKFAFGENLRNTFPKNKMDIFNIQRKSLKIETPATYQLYQLSC